MVFNVFKSVVWCRLTVISLILCFTSATAVEPRVAVSPAYGCVLYNETYICSGSRYQMHCNTRMHHFYYQTDQDQHQYQCMSNDCICVGNNDTCACYYNTSSCFCEIFSNSITVPTAVRPVLDCELNNDTYTCIGARYHMHCNTSVHYFGYYKYHFQNQYLYDCWSENCYCHFNKDSCWCYSHSSSCFCTNYGYNSSLSSLRNPVTVPHCELYNDIYVCSGAQYLMYCNTRMHHFYFERYQNRNQYYCWSNNGYCIGNKDTCTCYSSTLSSCFCETYNNSIALTTAVSPVTDPDCLLYNDMYICTGAQYRMYCNTQMHDFSYQRYQYQDQYRCVNNNCDCHGNKETCTCSISTFSSCFCETYGNITALATSVSPVYDCVLYNDTYICTGAQYRMYCNTSFHDLYYDGYYYYCLNNCYCTGDKDTCTCYSSTFSSCFCETYSNSIALTTAVSPAHGCELYNDTYICTGAQYRMYCNATMHDSYYWIYQYQNQDQYLCVNNNCYCFGNEDTCTCYSSTLSSCFCESNFSIPTTISPTTAGLIITLPDQCMSQASEGCLQNLFEQIEDTTKQLLPLTTVMSILTVAFNASEKIVESSSLSSPTELASYGNRMLKTSEKLISTLVKPTDTSDRVSFTLAAVEVEIFMVGPLVTLDKIPRLDTTNSSMDIDLIGIAKNNNERSAAVAFMSYNMMENLLKPDFFNTPKDTIKTMMSTVISATLPKTTNTKLTKPVNFTFRHIREFDPSGSLFCVYWNISEWIVDGCSVLKTNSSYTVCSCVHLSTFALIQTSSHPPKMDMVILVCVIVGLVFFSLALLTFALYKWSPVRDWIRGCIVHGPEGYNREELRSSTRGASDVFAVGSKPTTSKVSQKTQKTTTSC